MKNLSNLSNLSNSSSQDFINLILVKDTKIKKRGYLRYKSNTSSNTTTCYIIPIRCGEFESISVKFTDFKEMLSNLDYSHGNGDSRDPKFYECPIFEGKRKEKIQEAITFFENKGFAIWSKSIIEICIDEGYLITDMESTLVNNNAIKKLK